MHKYNLKVINVSTLFFIITNPSDRIPPPLVSILGEKKNTVIILLTHLYRPVRSTFAVQETASLGIMGAPEVPPLCRGTQSLGKQMLNTPVGINGLNVVEHQQQLAYFS